MSLRVAVIGCGNIGAKRAAAVDSHAGSRLILAADVSADRAGAVATRFGGTPSNDWEQALRPGIDVAVVAVPTKAAPAIILALIDAGKHVLCEKPLGRTLEEAREITERAAARGVVLETGFNLRYDPGLQEAHETVASGKIGSPYFLTCDYVNGTALTNTNEVGSLLDMGIHSIDLALWFLGGADRVSGALSRFEHSRDDNGFAMLHKGPVTAQLHFSFLRWRNRFHLEVSGSEGYVRVESLPKWGEQTVTVGARVRPSGAPVERQLAFTGDASWDRQWDHFVRCVAGQTSPDMERGLRSMLIASRIKESSDAGRALDVSAEDPASPTELLPTGGPR